MDLFPTLSCLDGLRVLELSTAAAGPTGGMLLALAGADVVRVESETALDIYRAGAVASGAGVDSSALFAAVNVGKRSISLDLRRPEGRELALRLIEHVDVVLESFAPGTAARLGLSFDSVREANPEVVLVSASATGQSGPKRDYRGYAPNFASLAGLTAVNVEEDGEPVLFGRSVDARVGMAIAVATLSGVLEARRTGSAVHVDLSDQEAIAALIGDQLAAVAAGVPDDEIRANQVRGRAPAGVLECGDGRYVWVDGSEPPAWAALCELVPALGAAGLASLGPAERWERRRELTGHLAAWAAGLDASEAEAALHAAGVPATVVLTLVEAADAAVTEGGGPCARAQQPDIGEYLVLGLPVRAPGAEERSSPPPSPRLGEHTAEVLAAWLGLGAGEIDELRDGEVLR